MDPARPDATAVAWANGKISAVGSDQEILKLTGTATKIVDLEGRLAVPGFIESHAHFSSMGFAKMNLELQDATSWEEIVTQVAKATKTTAEGQWIIGRGWHQEKWSTPLQHSVEGYPTHEELSAISPNHPVFLTHASGHLAMTNAVAMKLAGIDEETQDPDGGEILRDPQGKATGVLRETAEELVSRHYDRAAEAEPEWNRAIAMAGAECLAHGVTSFHDAGSSFQEIDRYKSTAERGALPVRLWIMVRDDPDRIRRQLAKYRLIDDAHGFLTVRAIKQSIDGRWDHMEHGCWSRMMTWFRAPG